MSQIIALAGSVLLLVLGIRFLRIYKEATILTPFAVGAFAWTAIGFRPDDWFWGMAIATGALALPAMLLKPRDANKHSPVAELLSYLMGAAAFLYTVIRLIAWLTDQPSEVLIAALIILILGLMTAYIRAVRDRGVQPAQTSSAPQQRQALRREPPVGGEALPSKRNWRF